MGPQLPETMPSTSPASPQALALSPGALPTGGNHLSPTTLSPPRAACSSQILPLPGLRSEPFLLLLLLPDGNTLLATSLHVKPGPALPFPLQAEPAGVCLPGTVSPAQNNLLNLSVASSPPLRNLPPALASRLNALCLSDNFKSVSNSSICCLLCFFFNAASGSGIQPCIKLSMENGAVSHSETEPALRSFLSKVLGCFRGWLLPCSQQKSSDAIRSKINIMGAAIRGNISAD